VVGADAAVGASLSSCHGNQSSSEDQTQHHASGKVKIRRVTKFQRMYEPPLNSRCRKGDMQ